MLFRSRVQDTIKNAAMTCIIDQGVYNDIHPKMKKKVGERMCNRALASVYGIGSLSDSEGPLFDHAEMLGRELVLYFRNAEGGLHAEQPAEVQRLGYDKKAAPAESMGFEIAEEDGVYLPAAVSIEKDRIVLSHDNMEHPVFGRYLWTNYGDVYIFGENGLPLAPFRTDRRDGFCPMNQSAGIQQNMETGNKQ